MNLYIIEYKGLWLGGVAVVLAKSARQAIELVKEDPSSVNFTEVEVVGLESIGHPKVVYNNNGDY
jgi:hypothetical protein